MKRWDRKGMLVYASALIIFSGVLAVWLRQQSIRGSQFMNAVQNNFFTTTVQKNREPLDSLKTVPEGIATVFSEEMAQVGIMPSSTASTTASTTTSLK